MVVAVVVGVVVTVMVVIFCFGGKVELAEEGLYLNRVSKSHVINLYPKVARYPNTCRHT